jgi:hypothetical protein
MFPREVLESRVFEDVVHGVLQAPPQPVRGTLRRVAAPGVRLAVPEGDRLAQGAHDLRHGDLARRPGKDVTPLRAADAFDQVPAPQPDEKLLQIVEGNLLPPRDVSDGHGFSPVRLPPRAKVEKGAKPIPSHRRKFHDAFSPFFASLLYGLFAVRGRISYLIKNINFRKRK